MTGNVIFAEKALLPGGWADNVAIGLRGGRIVEVTPGAAPQGLHRGIVLPAPVNLHSHAFQRAMAGMTERRGPDPRDTFWTWRRLMFRFLDQLTPEDVEAITAFVQMEMLEAGYAGVAEFHYLHHRPGGAPHDNLAEMSVRVAAAAAETGIGLTLLPVLYQQGGCDGRALGPGQVRFGNDPARFAGLWEGAKQAVTGLGDATIGVAPHSLRAVSRAGLAEVAGLAPDLPIHMHLAEQVAEVDEISEAYGARPSEWLLANHAVDPRWCLIHCTQMEPAETHALAATGAVAGLCPITEANLGDGIFDGVRYLDKGGRFGIGSDSNIRISLSEELRQLEYSQRLRDRGRAVLATPDRSTGRVLYEGAVAGGAQAAGRASGAIAPGMWADLVALDAAQTDLIARQGDGILDAWIFAGDDRFVTDTWAAGRHVVSEGRHRHHDTIAGRYRRVMAALGDRL
ncbi:formimidoylglutamate deiminase [Acidimangrovimonas sediminis]|uniref:formimidoylglutamate deiminase n=1 Tax=Acidimangrovimonas sediminis TaxID=2056283 RepID=UPI000C806E13|nr:formimidoylglutamate deiminase [Acidimangrovimonas sediminis]